MGDHKIAESELQKSLEYLKAVTMSKAGTQIAQGRQKKQPWPNPNLDVMDDYDKEKTTDEEEAKLKDGTDYKHQEELESSSSVGDESGEGEGHEEMEGVQYAGGHALKPTGHDGKMGKAVKKSPDPDPEEDDDEEEKEKKFPKKAKKSVAASYEEDLESDDVIQKGVEVSEFLSHQTRAGVLAFRGLEDRIAKLENFIVKSLNKIEQVSIAQANVTGAIGKAVLNQDQKIDKVAGTPLPPKSVTVVNKAGFEGGASNSDQKPNTNRETLMAHLVKGVVDGQISEYEVVKFESTGVLSTAAQHYLTTAKVV